MFSVIIFIFLTGTFAIIKLLTLKSFYFDLVKQENALCQKLSELQITSKDILAQKKMYDDKIADYFFFYDLSRKLAPILDKKELLIIFNDEIKHLGVIDKIEFKSTCEDDNCLKYRLRETGMEILCIRTNSKKITDNFIHLAKLISLCMERIDLYQQLQRSSIYDTLTQTYNRRYFTERYAKEFQRAKNYDLNMAFMLIDIDYFKKINDTYGHMVGDVVLREVALVIKNNIREIDFLSRYGGEEFALIVPDTDKIGAIMVAQRLCQLISSRKIHAFNEIVSVTISIGISIYLQDTLHGNSIIEMADKALYKAKSEGRNCAAWI